MIEVKRNNKMKSLSSRLTACSLRLLILIMLLFTGCEKVIEVDLNEANPEIVIEANLSSTTNLAEVKLSKTGSYFGDSPIEKISNAQVRVEDEFGGSFVLEEVENGLYQNDKISLKEETVYQLFVDIEEGDYESTSKLNPVVLIDSLTYFYDDGFAFLEEGYTIKIHFTDPAGQNNYYRINIFANDSIKIHEEELIIFDDRLVDGQALEIVLRGMIFEPGYSVTTELVSLDEGAYEYYKIFQDLINVNPGSAAPANPTSNISNGALGYFSAWSSDSKTVFIEEL